MSSVINVREKGQKRLKIWTLPKQKVIYIYKQGISSNICWVTFFASVIQFKKKTKNLILIKNDIF